MFTTACLEQDSGEAINRMGIDATISSVDLLDVPRIDDLPWCSLGMNQPVVYQD